MFRERLTAHLASLSLSAGLTRGLSLGGMIGPGSAEILCVSVTRLRRLCIIATASLDR